MTIKKYIGYKVRLYPTAEQEELFKKHIGDCRFIWNYMLDLQEKIYYNGGKHLSAFSMINLIAPLKRDGKHEWLNEVSNASLCETCRDLEKAYQQFFNKTAMFPRQKTKKRSKPSYPVRSNSMYFLEGSLVQIEKVGRVRFKSDYDFPIGKEHKFRNARVSYKNDKWFLGFVIECEVQTPVLTNNIMGIDLGIKELAVVAIGNAKLVFHNINKSKKIRKLEDRINDLQRRISHKYNMNKDGNAFIKTNNIVRCEDKLRKLYNRLNGIRHNYIHQVTHALVSMLPKRVVMENLDIARMAKEKRFSKSIYEQCWGEFIRQMKYKCELNGIEFVQVDRFYPSSKTCSCCGNKKKDLKLKDRIYVCDVCGTIIDRDFNAALNLSRYGMPREGFRP